MKGGRAGQRGPPGRGTVSARPMYKVGMGYSEGNQDASGPGREGPGLEFRSPSIPPSPPQDTGVFWGDGRQEA